MAIKQDTKKFTDEEIQDLRSLQVQIGGLTTRFGQLHIAKLKMKEEENKLMKLKLYKIKVKMLFIN